MNGLLVFDYLNDVVFVNGEAGFTDFIVQRCVKEQLLAAQPHNPSSPEWMQEYHNALVQLFAPLITSQRIMNSHFNNPYAAVHCEDGTIMAFSEAEERLLVSQDLSSMCVKLLHTSQDKLKGLCKDWLPTHMILTMNTKVLAMFSSKDAGELSESDVLLLILFTCSLNPVAMITCDKNDSSMERSSSPTSSASENSRFYSSRSSPILQGDSRHSEEFKTREDWDVIREQFHDIVQKQDVPSATTAMQNSDTLQDVEPSIEVTEELVNVYANFSSHLVYLQSTSTSLLPHIICTVRVTRGMILIIVFRTMKDKLSAGLVNSIKEIYSLLSTSNADRARQTIEAVERSLRVVTDNAKKSKPVSEMDLIIKKIQSRWNLLKKNGLFGYPSCKTSRHLPTSLECTLMQLSDNLKEGFQRLFVDSFNKVAFQSSIDNVIIDIQASLRYHLVDYIEYLDVKAMHNITMPTYYKEYPGLVHFIYVDRRSNQVTVPTTEDSSAVTSDGFSQKLILNKICKMVDMAWSHLEMGHLSFMWRDDSFVYTYFLWFEDMMGKPQKPERPLLTLVEDFPIPGVISDNFFKKLVRDCFPSCWEHLHCYELFCVHSSETEPGLVGKHARDLISNMWESSAAARSIVDLL